MKRDWWCEILQLESVTNQNRICSKHFSNDDFTLSRKNRKIIKSWIAPMRYVRTTTQNSLNPTTNASQDYVEQRMLQIDEPSTANTSQTTPTRTLEPMQTTSPNSSSDSLIVEVSPTSCAYISTIKTNEDTDEDDNLSELLEMYFGSNDMLQEQNFSDITKYKETLIKLKNVILNICQDNSALRQKIKKLELKYQAAVNMAKKLGGHITNDPLIHDV